MTFTQRVKTGRNMSELIPKLDKFSNIFEKFDSQYDIHFCTLNEIDDVVLFLDSYWKKGHVFVKSRKLLDWQHLDKNNNRYNFVVARDKKSSEIHALMGFIPTNFFDPSIQKVLVWGAIWKTREDVAPVGLGIYLCQFLTNRIKFDTWVGFGISEDSKKNNKLMGLKICTADQYFYANPNIKEFKIASGLESFRNPKAENMEGYTLTELSIDDYRLLSGNEECFNCVYPYKTKLYYLNRFFLHPYYKYRCYAIQHQNTIRAFFFVRESPAEEANCLRLVEYVGDYSYLQAVKFSISDLLVRGNYEYIDIVTSNVDDEILRKAGFINKITDSNIIIPNYFEPFLRKNVQMEYSYISLSPTFNPIINKGDSDQDRPSVL